MSMHLPANEEHDSPHIQPDDLTAVIAEHPIPPPSAYYLLDDESDEEAMRGRSAPFVRPFQNSANMPVVHIEQDFGPGPISPPIPGKKTTNSRMRSLIVRIAIIITLVVAALGVLWITVFAQPTLPLSTSRGTSPATSQSAQVPQPTHTVQQTPRTKTTPTTSKPTTATGTAGTTATNTQGNWVPQQLPTGWTAAGFTVGDALFAERTAWTFTDREEGLDFRNVGTRTQHGGTFTASVFILSPGGKTRFFQNDVRVVNNTLFDHVQTVQLIQAAVNATPSLVQLQTQGQNHFAWVDVSYQLFQSQIDPNNPTQRIEGLEMDSTTHQPRIHHMSVLLVRVGMGTQGPNAPMGGTGWLVSSYGLDLTSPLAIPEPI